jgi:hypothetical protein
MKSRDLVPEEETHEGKAERLTLVDVRKSIASKLQEAMRRFTALGDRIDTLQEAQKKIRDKEVLPLFAELDTLKLEELEEGGGWYIAERPGRKSFDKEKFTRLLVSRGVDPTLINKCMRAAEKPGTPFVEVSRGKGRKKDGEEEA